MVPWVRSRIRCELGNLPLVKLSAPSSGSAAAPPPSMFYALREREAEHFCVLRRGAFSCIFHRLVLLSGQDPLDWTALCGVCVLGGGMNRQGCRHVCRGKKYTQALLHSDLMHIKGTQR